MKIKFDTSNIKELQELKILVDELLDTDLKDMEFSEENMKKAKNICEKSKFINQLQYRFRGIDAKLVSPDGTELTKIY